MQCIPLPPENKPYAVSRGRLTSPSLQQPVNATRRNRQHQQRQKRSACTYHLIQFQVALMGVFRNWARTVISTRLWEIYVNAILNRSTSVSTAGFRWNCSHLGRTPCALIPESVESRVTDHRGRRTLEYTPRNVWLQPHLTRYVPRGIQWGIRCVGGMSLLACVARYRTATNSVETGGSAQLLTEITASISHIAGGSLCQERDLCYRTRRSTCEVS